MRFGTKSLRIFIWICLIGLGSCIQLGINPRHKTPKRGRKAPTFSKVDTLKGDNTPGRACYDVHYYAMDLEFDMPHQSVSGKVDMHFILLSKTRQIQMDLAKDLVLDSVVMDGKRLSFKREFSALFVDFLREGEAGQHLVLSAYYHGNPKVAKNPPWNGGTVWKKDAGKHPWCGVSCEGDGAWTWLPIKGYIGDEADSCLMRYTVPADLMAIGNGTLEKVEELSNHRKAFTWKVRYPINNYNITYYLGNFTSFSDAYVSVNGQRFSMNYYVLPEHLEKAKTHFQQAKRVIKQFEKYFGPYPFPKDGYKLVESPYEGMEHQSGIAYGNGFTNAWNLNADYIIVHESAHEWWGNAVSVRDFSDIWIHEGFATYAEALFVEGESSFLDYVNYMRSEAMFVVNKWPVVGPDKVFYWDYKDSDVYMKGAMFLHSLRLYINNDDLFFTLIKTFYQTHCYGFANTEDFLKLANQITGRDLKAFFYVYLYRREVPRLEYHVEFTKSEVRIQARIPNIPDGMVFPVVMQLGTTYKRMEVGNVTQEMVVEGQLNSVRINCYEFYLERKEIKDELGYSK